MSAAKWPRFRSAQEHGRAWEVELGLAGGIGGVVRFCDATKLRRTLKPPFSPCSVHSSLQYHCPSLPCTHASFVWCHRTFFALHARPLLHLTRASQILLLRPQVFAVFINRIVPVLEGDEKDASLSVVRRPPLACQVGRPRVHQAARLSVVGGN